MRLEFPLLVSVVSHRSLAAKAPGPRLHLGNEPLTLLACRRVLIYSAAALWTGALL